MDNMVYESTVRGCAWNCLPKDDFQNCSSELHGSRGCVTRNCCRDNDLCNQGSRTNSVLTSSHLSCLFLLVLSSYFVTWKYFYLLLKMLFIFVGILWFVLLVKWIWFSFYPFSWNFVLVFLKMFCRKNAKVPHVRYVTYMVLSKYKKDQKYFVIISFHKKKQIQSFGVGLSPIYYRQVMALIKHFGYSEKKSRCSWLGIPVYIQSYFTTNHATKAYHLHFSVTQNSFNYTKIRNS